MIEIITLNSSANLLYFEEYLLSNYSFKSFIVGVDSLHLEFETEPNESEQTDIINFYNSITESDWLDIYKQERFESINQRTQELIELGYSYSGNQFSLSDKAQTNILALYATKDDPILVYPITFNTIDDLVTFDAVDSSEIAGMYYTALATKKAHLDSGTALKDQIRIATTKTAVDLIEDNR